MVFYPKIQQKGKDYALTLLKIMPQVVILQLQVLFVSTYTITSNYSNTTRMQLQNHELHRIVDCNQEGDGL